MKKSLYSRIIPIGSNFIVKRKGRWGIVDASDRQQLPIEYTRVHWFEGGYAGIQINGMWGLVDSDGRICISPQYDTIRYYSQHKGCEVEKDGDIFVVDTANNVILHKEGCNVFFIKDKLVACSSGSRTLYNYDGTPFSKPHSYISSVCGRYVANDWGGNKDKEYIIKHDGTEVLMPDYEIGAFIDYIAQFRYQDKYGIIDDNGKIVVPNKYDYISLASGVIAINEGNVSHDGDHSFLARPFGGVWYFWNYQLREITPYRYDKIATECVREGGKAWFARREGSWYRITPYGETPFAENDELFNKKIEIFAHRHRDRSEEYGKFAILEDENCKRADRKLFVRACDGKTIRHFYYTPYLPMEADGLKAHWKIADSYVNIYGQDMPNLHAFKMPKQKKPRFVFKLNASLLEMNDEKLLEIFVCLLRYMGWNEKDTINMYCMMNTKLRKAIFCDWLIRKLKRDADFRLPFSDVGYLLGAILDWIKRRGLENNTKE